MTVPGVSWHSGRIEIANPDLSDDDTMVAFLEQLRGTIGAAVSRVCSCLPTYMVRETPYRPTTLTSHRLTRPFSETL